MGEVKFSREILQIMPAIPGQFAWYYFDDAGNPDPAPVVAWALARETRSWKGDEGDESEAETVVHPLVQGKNILEYGFGESWNASDDASNSIGLWACANATDDELKKAIERKRA